MTLDFDKLIRILLIVKWMHALELISWGYLQGKSCDLVGSRLEYCDLVRKWILGLWSWCMLLERSIFIGKLTWMILGRPNCLTFWFILVSSVRFLSLLLFSAFLEKVILFILLFVWLIFNILGFYLFSLSLFNFIRRQVVIGFVFFVVSSLIVFWRR